MDNNFSFDAMSQQSQFADLQKEVNELKLKLGFQEKIVKEKAVQTHYEIAIALHYIVYKANDNTEINKNKLVELLYYLRKENPKSRIENTSEYNQYKEVFGNDDSRRIKILKQHGSKAISFLENLGLNSVADLIRKDLK